MELKTDTCTVSLNERTGALVSCRAASAPAQEFLVPGHGDYPLFVVQYLDREQRLCETSSLQARDVSIQQSPGAVGVQVQIR